MRKPDINAFIARGLEEGRGLLVNDLLDVERYRNPTVGRVLFGTSGRFFRQPITRFKAGVAGAAGFVSGVARRAFRRDEAEPLPTDSQDAAERFEVARYVYGRNDADLASDQEATHRAFLFYMAGFFGILAVALCSWDAYATGLPWFFDLPARFAILPVALALAMKSSFYNWQLRTRRLGGLMEFLRSPSQWWPEPPPGGDGGVIARSTPAMLLLLACGALCASMIGAPSAAMAQAVPGASSSASSGVAALIATPPSTDLWYQLLGMTFPGVGPLNAPVGVTAVSNGIASAFAAFLTAIMSIASAMLTYQTVIGVAATAHEGTVLGKRWNMMFAPLRVVYGFGTLAPVVKGYCVLQIVVIYIAIASGSIANLGWSAFISGMSGSNISSPQLQQTIGIVRDDMTIELCQTAIDANHQVATAASSGNTNVTAAQAWPTTYQLGPMSMSNSMVGRGAKAVMHAAEWLVNGSSTSGNQSSVGRHDLVWDYGRCGTITASYSLDGDLGTDSDVIAMDKSRIQAMDTLRGSLRGISTQIVQAVQPGSGTDIDNVLTPALLQQILQAKSTYDNALTSAAQTYVNSANQVSFSDFQKNATAAGWVAAGAYYPTLGRMSAEVSSLIDTQPDVHPNSTAQLLDTDTELSRTLGATLIKWNSWWDHQLTTTSPSGLSVDAARAGLYSNGGAWGAAKYMFTSDNLISQMMYKITSVTPGQGVALQDMTDFGNNIIDAGWGALAIVGATKFIQDIPYIGTVVNVADKMDKWSNSSKSKGEMLSLAGMFILFIATTMLMCGIFHAFVLPLLPFMHFTFAVMGMLINVVCGVIAAPLLAFAHVRLDGGDDFIDQKQSPGYQLLFSTLCGAPLTMFGLYFSMIIFEAMVWLSAKTMYAAMASATAGDTFGVLGTITYVIIIAVMNYQIATRSFHLITQVPDRVFRWFGVNGFGSSDEHQHATAAVGALVSHTRGGLDNAGRAVSNVYGGQQGQGGVNQRRGGQNGQNAEAGQRATAEMPGANQGADKPNGGKGGGGDGGGKPPKPELAGATEGADKPNKTRDD